MGDFRSDLPLGTDDPQVFFANVGNLDEAVTTRESETWVDRKGVARQTWYGMEEAFQEFLINSGYENIGDYGPGLEITARNQIFWRDGELYRAGAVLELPYTTSGDWGSEEGLFVGVGDQSLRQELAQPGGAEKVGFDINQEYADGTTGNELILISETLGIVRDGVDINDLVSDGYRRIWIPSGIQAYGLNIDVPDFFTLIIDGSLILPQGAPDGSVILRKTGGQNVCITGVGLIDGNKINQSGDETKHMLVNFNGVDGAVFSVRNASGNYWPRALPSTPVGAAVYFEDCTRSSIMDSRVTDYGREGFWMRNCEKSSMKNLMAFGGDDSWSGMQFSGKFNRASNWYCENAGASSGSFDCQNSVINGWIGVQNRFTNNLNFGHQGIPASGSIATNLIAIGGDQVGTGNVMNGINVGGSTIGLKIIGAQVEGSISNGVNISDSSTSISISEISVKDCGGYAVTAFSNSSDTYLVTGLTENGNTLGSVRATGSAIISVTNSILDKAPTWASSASVLLRNTTVSDGVLSGGVSIVGATPSAPITVSNPSVRSTSRVMLQPSNIAAVSANPFVLSVAEGSFTISVENSAYAGAFCRYAIF